MLFLVSRYLTRQEILNLMLTSKHFYSVVRKNLHYGPQSQLGTRLDFARLDNMHLPDNGDELYYIYVEDDVLRKLESDHINLGRLRSLHLMSFSEKGMEDVGKYLMDKCKALSEQYPQVTDLEVYDCASGDPVGKFVYDKLSSSPKDTKPLDDIVSINVFDINRRFGINKMTLLHRAVLDGHYEIAEKLVNFGANVAVQNIYGETPLHSAAKLGRIKMIELLLNKHNTVNLPDKNGWTALHFAVKSNYIEVVSLLLIRGADPNAIDTNDQTPLHIALTHAKDQIILLLIQHGARVDLKDESGQTPKDLAIQYGRYEPLNAFFYESPKEELVDRPDLLDGLSLNESLESETDESSESEREASVEESPQLVENDHCLHGMTCTIMK